MLVNDPTSTTEGKKSHIAAILIAIASQENCDGEPYDQMQIAAEYIIALEYALIDIIRVYLVADELEADEKNEEARRLFDKIIARFYPIS